MPDNRSAAHPRLFITEPRLREIRSAIQQEGATHAEAFAMLRKRVQRNALDQWHSDAIGRTGNWTYACAYKAQAEACMHLITGERRYASMAFNTLRQIHTDADGDTNLPERGYGLARATIGLGFALAWDWCSPAWTTSQCSYILGRIRRALDAWPHYHHVNFGATRGSNWVGVCRGGELILMLAANKQTHRATRFAMLKRELRKHLRAGYDELGVTQEGIGYCCYAGIFLVPAVLALRSVGDHDLDDEFNRHAWWKQVMFTGSFAPTPTQHPHPGQTAHLMSGVGGPTIADQGWASLLLPTVPDDHLPHYLWWYDRHIGRLASRQLSSRYERQRQGTIWTLLFYPQKVRAKDPSHPARFPHGVTASHGFCYFRSRWQDQDDVQVAITGDCRHHANAWDQPEVLQLGLLAHGTLFFGGPNKNEPGEDTTRKFSTLLIDGRHHRGEGATEDCGELTSFEVNNRRGYAIVGGGRQYANIGAKVSRHLMVDFTGEAGPAILSTLDRIRPLDDQPHNYTWQANLGDPSCPWAIEAQADVEADLPCFLLKAPRKAWVKGWVVSPNEVSIEAKDPFRIQTAAKACDLWIVLTVGRGRPPVARRTGSGMKATLHLAGRDISWDRKSRRIRCR